jgi:hypothetical protein
LTKKVSDLKYYWSCYTKGISANLKNYCVEYQETIEQLKISHQYIIEENTMFSSDNKQGELVLPPIIVENEISPALKL